MTDYEKLKQIIDEIPELISANISSSDPKFQAWKMKAVRFLIKKFGERSVEFEAFKDTSFSPFAIRSTTESEYVSACQRGLRKTSAVFQTYLDDLNDEQSNAVFHQLDVSKIFIVHGHDGALKESVARIIEKQGIEAIILSEKANQGRTIIEKFEDYSDVGGAICLFTADDIGNEKSKSEGRSRARQNVVFESGYFMGKLGRNHIVILADDGVEMPSDLSGVVYTNTASWQFELLKELNAMGYNIDTNKLLQ